MGYFSLRSSSDKQYFFNLHADNHERILTSERYTTRAAAHNGIASVKENAPDEKSYEKLAGKGGQFYFNLRAKNHQVIGTSEQYSSERSRDHGIASVMANAPGAKIVDDAGA